MLQQLDGKRSKLLPGTSALKSSEEEDYQKSLNTQPNDKRPLLVKEAIRLDLDIVCLFESRLLGQKTLK